MLKTDTWDSADYGTNRKRRSHSCSGRIVQDECPVPPCGTGRYRVAPSVVDPTGHGPIVEATRLDGRGRHRPLRADVLSCCSVPPWAVRDIRMGRSSSGLGVACSLASEHAESGLCSRSRWPSSSWMLRRSVPASSRWVAKEWRSTWGLSGLEIPICWRSFWQATRTVLAFNGWPGSSPGKSQSLGLRQCQ